jgi:hypothetical protein
MHKNIANFQCEPWFPLNEGAAKACAKNSKPASSAVNTDKGSGNKAGNVINAETFALEALTGNAKALLYNVSLRLLSSSRERIKALGLSGRTYENAKLELVNAGLIIESAVGKSKHLMPKSDVFDWFGLPCPYMNKEFVEHSFYMHIVGSTFGSNPSNHSVTLEYKLGTSGHTGDIVTQSHDGILMVFELTLSAGNIIQNCQKYHKTAFTRIIFLCRNSDLMKAVKSTVFKAGLPLELLAKIDFMLLSKALKRHK